MLAGDTELKQIALLSKALGTPTKASVPGTLSKLQPYGYPAAHRNRCLGPQQASVVLRVLCASLVIAACSIPGTSEYASPIQPLLNNLQTALSSRRTSRALLTALPRAGGLRSSATAVPLSYYSCRRW